MSERAQHLRLLHSPPPDAVPAEDYLGTKRMPIAFLHEWRAAKIVRSKAMHPTNLARTAALPAPRPVP
ncbi:MAG TPA: hypothetical protein VGR49_00100 [Actinomycetota bacterium]|nr:hypothetical protein [Actinomycetota bacterium]